MQVNAKNVFSLPDGRHNVTIGLSLVVANDGRSRRFVVRYKFQGRTRDKPVGGAKEVSLTEAIKRGKAIRGEAFYGKDPARSTSTSTETVLLRGPEKKTVPPAISSTKIVRPASSSVDDAPVA